MQYRITLKTERGAVTAFAVTGDLPDGIHEVSGTEDADHVSLRAERRNPEGEWVETAQHSHSKEH